MLRASSRVVCTQWLHSNFGRFDIGFCCKCNRSSGVQAAAAAAVSLGVRSCRVKVKTMSVGMNPLFDKKQVGKY